MVNVGSIYILRWLYCSKSRLDWVYARRKFFSCWTSLILDTVRGSTVQRTVEQNSRLSIFTVFLIDFQSAPPYLSDNFSAAHGDREGKAQKVLST
jgi:hypothetical protein